MTDTKRLNTILAMLYAARDLEFKKCKVGRLTKLADLAVRYGRRAGVTHDDVYLVAKMTVEDVLIGV